MRGVRHNSTRNNLPQRFAKNWHTQFLSLACTSRGAGILDQPIIVVCVGESSTRYVARDFDKQCHQPLSPLQGTTDTGGEGLQSWNISLPSLATQLTAGMGALELDLFPDTPLGGAYRYSAALKALGGNGTINNPDLLQPGIKVMHVTDADFRSSCTLLSDCLQQMRNWSDARQGRHLPITVYLELKGPQATGMLLSAHNSQCILPHTNILPHNCFPTQTLSHTNTPPHFSSPPHLLVASLFNDPRVASALAPLVSLLSRGPPPTAFTTAVPWDFAALEELQATIADVFDADQILLPEDVEGNATSLAAAVLNKPQWCVGGGGWWGGDLCEGERGRGCTPAAYTHTHVHTHVHVHTHTHTHTYTVHGRQWRKAWASLHLY